MNSALQRQTAVTAYFSRRPLLLLAFAGQNWAGLLQSHQTTHSRRCVSVFRRRPVVQPEFGYHDSVAGCSGVNGNPSAACCVLATNSSHQNRVFWSALRYGTFLFGSGADAKIGMQQRDCIITHATGIQMWPPSRLSTQRASRKALWSPQTKNNNYFSAS